MRLRARVRCRVRKPSFLFPWFPVWSQFDARGGFSRGPGLRTPESPFKINFLEQWAFFRLLRGFRTPESPASSAHAAFLHTGVAVFYSLGFPIGVSFAHWDPLFVYADTRSSRDHEC